MSPPPIIHDEISRSGGVLPFRRFMELALYHPEQGYYASGRASVGRQGDFITSVSVGPIYGRLLASVCREVWERMGCPQEFSIVEQGANDGTMAADILEAAGHHPPFAAALRYRIVEPFTINQKRQQEKLAPFPHVSWHSTPADLPQFTGIHLSNELLDAFPVDSLRWNGTLWEEECVSSNGGEITWTTRPITDPELLRETERLPTPSNSPTASNSSTPLRIGWRFEINRGITPWLAEIHSRMTRGMILTIDYGQAGEDRFAPHRADGTLLAYRAQERFDDPLDEPGLRDITAQVDFTDLAAKAVSIGFTPLAYSDQQHFLMGAAEPWMRSLGDIAHGHDKDLRALKTLLTPSLMGSQFKALALGKDFPEGSTLPCLKYQRPGVGVL